METTTKNFASIFFIGYMLAAFVWPTYRTWRQTGINPLTFGNSDSAHDFVGKWFKITIALIPVNIVLQWLDLQHYALPLRYLEIPVLQVLGIVLCLISWLWTLVAQWQMGNSWRIGIDEKHKSEFVTKGLFGISRNPIFFGMLLTLTGYLLLIPNALSVLTLVCGYLLMQIQIRLEEEFLSNQYNESYKRYKNEVRRWI
ncbi:MAG: isoprenylcysteine carboxylmethyltransferase family protein [Bacteroidota bacterium]|nr:isoprenylcysteine carboxylmethyltransferase family protein [Bacteroidota bacterium]